MQHIIEGSLLTWRLTSLVSSEKGPFEIFSKIRDLSGVKFDEYSTPYATNQISQMILCFWCCSIWAGFAAAVLLKKPLWYGLVYSAGALIVRHYLRD